MKVLVTGASGNVGRFVVDELLKLGEQVVAGGTDPQKLATMFGQKVETVFLDFTNGANFAKCLEGVDRVFLMRPPHLGKPEDLYPFIDAMKRHDIKLVTFLSLMGVERNPVPPHHKIEKYIERVKIPYSHIRPGFFMQNLSGIHATEIREQNMVFVPAGQSKTSFIDAEDVGLAAAALLHQPERYGNTAHTITGGEALDYYQVAEILSDVVGRQITYAKPGLLRYRKHYRKNRGLEKGYVNVTVALYLMTRMGTAKQVTNDFFELTGRNTRSFTDFARKNIRNFS